MSGVVSGVVSGVSALEKLMRELFYGLEAAAREFVAVSATGAEQTRDLHSQKHSMHMRTTVTAVRHTLDRLRAQVINLKEQNNIPLS